MEPSSEPVFIDLKARIDDGAQRRIAWSSQSQDLNVNLITLNQGEEIAEHRNNEVDVLLTGIDGSGQIDVNGEHYTLQAGQALIIPKGTTRRIDCTDDRFAYLTCHRLRSGLWPVSNARDTPGSTE